ncbi:MAG: hypothetical protein SOI38_08980 [Eggerthellaceae bacterium]|jgi:hypothetical protein
MRSAPPTFAATPETAELKVVEMSDLHVMAPQLFGENEAFHIAEKPAASKSPPPAPCRGKASQAAAGARRSPFRSTDNRLSLGR